MSLLSLLSRTNVEYDYVGKQSIPTTGLPPASPMALWAAVLGPTPETKTLITSAFPRLGIMRYPGAIPRDPLDARRIEKDGTQWSSRGRL
jgi:hypothetical protein